PHPHTMVVHTFKIKQTKKRMSIEERFKAVSTYDLTLHDDVESFPDSARFALDAFKVIADVHPISKAVFEAFRGVVTLELKRRENNTKVRAVHVAMKSMLSVFVQLQDVKDPHEVDNDGDLGALLKRIEDAVRKAGSSCDWYMKKSPMSTSNLLFTMIVSTSLVLLERYLKAIKYEQHLAETARGFMMLEGELQRALAVHTLLGVNTVNEKLNDQGSQLDMMQKTLETILARLDTPRDMEIREYIRLHGGPEASIKDTTVLKELAAKCDENSKLSVMDDKDLQKHLQKLRNSLMRDLSEDINSALENNLTLFDRKLEVHLRDIKSEISSHTAILESLSGGFKEIGDPGWKSTVKARHLVLALRDFYINRSHSNGDAPNSSQQQVSPPTTTDLEDSADQTPQQPIVEDDDDAWAISYINVSYLQAIAEAIDDDGSGFISIREVNDFINEKPPGLTVCQWLAYWAAGWRSSIAQYTDKIYRLLRKIYDLRDKVLPENLEMLDYYLDEEAFYRLDLLLRAAPRDVYYIRPDLVKLRDEFGADEEKKLMEKLEEIKYNLDWPSTVSLVTGPGRIERQHLKIVQLGRSNTLDDDEFEEMWTSLQSIFEVLQYRRGELSAIFKQMHIDPERQFRDYAFGIFSNSDAPWDISDYKLGYVLTTLPYEEGENDDVIASPDIPMTTLKYPIDTLPELQRPSQLPVQSDLADHPNDLYGHWAGFCMMDIAGEDKQIPYRGLFRIVFEEHGDNDDFLPGSATTYLGSMKITYVITPKDTTSQEVDFVMVYDDVDWMRCVGTFDVSSATIQGVWYRRHSVVDQPPPLRSTVPSIHGSSYTSLDPQPASNNSFEDQQQHPGGRFSLSRTPAPLAWFRHNPEASGDKPAKARWNFALSAVTYIIRRGKSKLHDVTIMIHNIHRFIKLLINIFLSFDEDSLSHNETKLWQLATTIPPNLDEYYYSTARHLSRALPFHFFLQKTITSARSLSEKMKLRFRMSDDDVESTKDDSVTDSHPQTCSVCKEEIHLPCWVCLECESEDVICNACDEKHRALLPVERIWSSATSKAEGVHAMHPMVWIRDDQYVDIPIFDQLSRVEGRLNTVEEIVRKREEKVPQRIAEGQVAERLATLELQIGKLVEASSGLTRVGGHHSEAENLLKVGRIEDMIAQVSGRLTTLETKLDQLIVSLSRSS
ncbi:hypothetical protein DXG01_000398, partial [Tephrocybe rancida]